MPIRPHLNFMPAPFLGDCARPNNINLGGINSENISKRTLKNNLAEKNCFLPVDSRAFWRGASPQLRVKKMLRKRGQIYFHPQYAGITYVRCRMQLGNGYLRKAKRMHTVPRTLCLAHVALRDF